MNEDINKGPMEKKDVSQKAIEDCLEALGKISETCCVPERSPQMAAIFKNLEDVLEDLRKRNNPGEHYTESLDRIVECGAQIGSLYVGCCTETREPLYQRILEQLNRAYGSLSGI